MNIKLSKKQWGLIFVFLFLLLWLYVLIFSFSEQTAVESGSLSFQISRISAMVWNQIIQGNWSEEILDNVAVYLENPIRKLAHFVEYTIMGFLISGILKDIVIGKKKYAIILLWVFLSAMADEIHQLFVPGRCGNLPDVILDTCGGGFGIVLFGVCLFFVNKITLRN